MKAAEGQAGQAQGVQPQRLRVSGPDPDLEGAFAAMRAAARGRSSDTGGAGTGGSCGERIAKLAARDRLPTLFPPSRVAAGGLLAYGTSQVEAIRRMAAYVDKVLKGGQTGRARPWRR